MESTEQQQVDSQASELITGANGKSEQKKKAGGTFRREIAPIINDLLEDIDSAPLHINANKDLEKIIKDLEVINKAVDELRKTMRSEKRGKSNTAVVTKIVKSIDKAIAIASEHEVDKDDAQKVILAVKGGVQKLSNHVLALKTAKEQSGEKERFSF